MEDHGRDLCTKSRKKIKESVTDGHRQMNWQTDGYHQTLDSDSFFNGWDLFLRKNNNRGQGLEATRHMPKNWTGNEEAVYTGQGHIVVSAWETASAVSRQRAAENTNQIEIVVETAAKRPRLIAVTRQVDWPQRRADVSLFQCWRQYIDGIKHQRSLGLKYET